MAIVVVEEMGAACIVDVVEVEVVEVDVDTVVAVVSDAVFGW